MITWATLDWMLIGIVIAIVYVIAKFIDQYASHKAKKSALILEQKQEEHCLISER